jgi:hypothetical protein
VISGCIAGGEAGVDLADAFSEYLGVLSNGARELLCCVCDVSGCVFGLI